MTSEIIKRDQNHVTVLAGVTDDANQDVVMLRVDPVTKRLLASATGGGSGGVESVTGLNTDNTDPDNPVIQISVDGSTITGAGTPGSPLVATGSGAPTNAQYVTLATNASLSAERVLTGTSNQVIITDNGAGSTVVLSLPQNIHTGASPTFVGGTFTGAVSIGTGLTPATNDSAALGTSSVSFSDLFLASGAAIGIGNTNWLAVHTSGVLTVGVGDLRITNPGTASESVVTISGSQTLSNKQLSGAQVIVSFAPTVNDGAALGSITNQFSDLFLAEGGVINWDNGDATITQTSNDITIAGITTFGVGTSTAVTLGTIEVGNASDTTISRSAAGAIAVEGVVIPSISSTNTLTNKRITKRTGTTTSSATPTINTDNVDFYSITALAVAITSFTTNLSGTPTDAQTLWIAITDNGTARAITWGSSFEASGNVALPTTTVISTRLDVGFVWNTVTSKWRCVAVA